MKEKHNVVKLSLKLCLSILMVFCLLSGSHARADEKPKLGIHARQHRFGKGLLVVKVNPGSPADKVWIREGDLICEFNGKSFEKKNVGIQEFISHVQNSPPDGPLPIVISRNGRRLSATVNLSDRPKMGITASGHIGQGFKIKKVKAGSVADEAGLLPGDIIIGYGKHHFNEAKMSAKILVKAVKNTPYGTHVIVTVLRNGKIKLLTVFFKRSTERQIRITASKKEMKKELTIGKRKDENPFLRDLFAAYKAFDDLYWRRQNSQGGSTSRPPGEEWEKMASLLEPLMNIPFTLERKGNGQFMTRTLLIQGECYLFGSMEYYRKKNKNKFYETYEKGIKTLERVINISNSQIDYLPRYSLMILYDQDNKKKQHPYAGYDIIGVGYKSDLGINTREVTYKAKVYDKLSSFQMMAWGAVDDTGDPGEWEKYISGKEENEEKYRRIAQIHTSEKAKELLSHFCPWGVNMYKALKKAGYITYSVATKKGTIKKDLDFRILRPYGEDNVQRIFEIALADSKVPAPIRKELEAVIGKGKKGVVKTLKGNSVEIKWDWVQKKPTYTIWIVSPSAYDIGTISRAVGFLFKAIKILFGGLWDLVIGETIGALAEAVGNYYGKDGRVYGYTSVLVDGNNYGLDNDFIIDRNPNFLKFGKQIAVNSFKYLEKKEIEYLFDCIHPNIASMGITYNGRPIPPIIIRGDVYGYITTSVHQYRKTLRVMRYYFLNPAGSKDVYDLSYDELTEIIKDGEKETVNILKGNEYRGKTTVINQEKVKSHFWRKVPNAKGKPLGSREYVTDFTPKGQVITINFDIAVFSAWRTKKEHEEAEPYLEIHFYSPVYGPSPLFSHEIPVDFGPKMRVRLVKNIETYSEGRYPHGHIEFDAESLQKEIFPQKSFKLTSEYTIKITRNDKEVAEFFLILASRPKEERHLNVKIGDSAFEHGIVYATYEHKGEFDDNSIKDTDPFGIEHEG
jgi:hypothetical protein